MRHLKLFEEIKINWKEFPFEGEHDLSTRERKILTDLVGYHLNRFTIKVEDHYYYVEVDEWYNRFDNFNDLKDYILFNLCMHGDDNPEEFLELLKTSKLDLSFDDNDPIRWATREGHTEIVKHLLRDSRVDPSAGDNYPIESACSNGYIEIVKLLLNDPIVNPGVDENWPIRSASRNGHIEIVKLLLNDPRVDPNEEPIEDESFHDGSPIKIASRKGHKEIVRLLLNDERVRSKLTKEEINKYTNEIS